MEKISLEGKYIRATQEITGSGIETILGLKSVLEETSGWWPTFKQKHKDTQKQRYGFSPKDFYHENYLH